MHVHIQNLSEKISKSMHTGDDGKENMTDVAQHVSRNSEEQREIQVKSVI